MNACSDREQLLHNIEKSQVSRCTDTERTNHALKGLAGPLKKNTSDVMKDFQRKDSNVMSPAE